MFLKTYIDDSLKLQQGSSKYKEGHLKVVIQEDKCTNNHHDYPVLVIHNIYIYI